MGEMMGNGNALDTITVAALASRNFFIPNYQRGYRWTTQQVKDLLNDVDAFVPKIEQNEQREQNATWYCLQPLVVKKMSNTEKDKKDLDKEKEWYEVVDGQQRITTLFLLIHYINEKWVGEDKLEEPCIVYQTREDSEKFLKELKIDNNSNSVTSGSTPCNKYIDFNFITNAYLTIRTWVNDKGKHFDRTNFQSKFQFYTRVIWYELNNDLNPIDTFLRINMGKISLTNSELIKALFLQKRNFDNATAELRQIEIANEWDRMEYAFQNEDFWWFINRDKNDMSARIEYLFNFMCNVAKTNQVKLEEDIGIDEYATFRFFNNKFSCKVNYEEVEKAWNDVKEYFGAFEEWFNNPIWYHYIGYQIYCGTSIVDIYLMYQNSLKSEFLEKLKAKIKEQLSKINVYRIINDNNTKHSIELPYEAKNYIQIRQLLLLFNIEYIVKQYIKVKEKENAELFVRFPFELFKKEKWDIEHIDSYTENVISDYATQIEWLGNAKSDLRDEISLNEEIALKIERFLQTKNNGIQFSELKDEIMKIAGEFENSEEEKNGFGNLTLLDANTNRSYGNALFSTKRKKIIERETNGKFIPICTKNVFLKYFDKDGSSRTKWSSLDIENYQNHIISILQDFLIMKEGK